MMKLPRSILRVCQLTKCFLCSYARCLRLHGINGDMFAAAFFRCPSLEHEPSMCHPQRTQKTTHSYYSIVLLQFQWKLCSGTAAGEKKPQALPSTADYSQHHPRHRKWKQNKTKREQKKPPSKSSLFQSSRASALSAMLELLDWVILL